MLSQYKIDSLHCSKENKIRSLWHNAMLYLGLSFRILLHIDSALVKFPCLRKHEILLIKTETSSGEI